MAATQENPIVIGFDGSAGAERAVRAAGKLLAPAQLVVVTVEGRPIPGLGQAMRREAELFNARGVELAREFGEARGVVIAGDKPGTGLLRAAEDLGGRAIVVGFRGRSTARSMLLGSCSYDLAHHSPLPTLVVPGTYPLTGSAGTSGMALLALGPNEPEPAHAHRALELVATHDVLVMHVGVGRMTTDHLFDDAGHQLPEEAVRARIDELNEQARSASAEAASMAAQWLSERSDKQFSIEGSVRVDGAWQGIVERADQPDIDLVVVGARSLRTLDRAMLGSVSNAVVHHASKPVLIARRAT